MRKLFTLTAALLASFSLWAESVTFSATEMSGKTDGVTKGQITALCPTSASDQQWYKEGGSTIKDKAITLNSSADSAVIIPVAGKSLHFRVADGYTITGISIEAAASKDSICGEPIVIWAGAINKTPAYVGNIEVPSRAETSKPAAIEITNIPENATGFALYRRIKYNSGTGEIGSGSNYGRSLQTWNIFNVTVTYSANCTSPANPLVLSSDAAETVYVGDVINLSTTGGNGAGIGIAGTADEPLAGLTGTTWTATAGKHTFVATQVEYNGYCAQESELVFNVLEKTPVTACSIDGPTTGYVGNELTYTATAANATDYQWLVDGVDANTNAASFTYTGAKGEHSIVCKARNDFNETDEWIASDPIALTVTKLCGELIKAVYDPNTKKSTVTGVIGGTADRYTQDNGKLGSNGHYYGAVLASGSFMAGDVVTVKASILNGGNTATLYADKGETELGSAAFGETTLTAVITLTKSASAVYLYRKDGGCNPNIESISVTRSCEDSNDATIHSLTVNGNEVAENDGKFEYTLSSSYEEPTVTIAFEIHPLATIKYDLSNPYELTTPDLGGSRGQAFTIIAEDGTEKTYTVQIYKSASLDNDATLKALTVGSYELTPAFDPAVTEYTVTKPYEAAMPVETDVTATPNSSNAKGAVVAIAGNVITITVTAENDDTKVYTVTVNNAPAVKKINEVILSNGYSAYIVEGQTDEPFIINGFYLAGQDAPTVSSYQVNDGTTWAIDGNNITLTGADASTAAYQLVLEAVSPAEFNAAEITFDGTEAWAKAANGFDDSKGGWKFSKTDNDFSREIAGKTHVEFFLPACDTVVLKTGTSGTERDVRFYVNGTEVGEKAKLTKAGVALAVKQSAPFMLTVASAQTGGDGGVGAIRMAKAETPTAIDNTEAEIKAVKFIENGQLFILKNGIKYNANGAIVK